MQEILITTSYYPPEIGAASNRINHLAEGLAKKGYKVTVITPMPNYPTGKILDAFKGKLIHRSTINSVNVIRLWLYANNSKNSLLRLTSMLSYSFSLAIFYLFNNVPKRVIIQSPPLLVAFTSVFLLKKRNRTLILNVSDLWPKAGLELGALKNGRLVKVLLKIEGYLYKSADVILGQSEEIINHIKSRESDKNIVLYRNYPVFDYSIESLVKERKSERIQLCYAGLLGVAQGILDLCKTLDYTKADLHIYGDGAERNEIVGFLEQNKNLPIFYHGKLDREKLHKTIVQHDLAIIPLRKRIYGSVPSKIFEYSKLGLPILYYGGGEGEDLIKKYNLGLVAKPGDIDGLNSLLSKVSLDILSKENRLKIIETANSKFVLDNQIDQLIKFF